MGFSLRWSETARRSRVARDSSRSEGPSRLAGGNVAARKLGLIFGARPSSGGGFSYEVALRETLESICDELEMSLQMFHFNNNQLFRVHRDGASKMISRPRRERLWKAVRVVANKSRPSESDFHDCYFRSEGFELLYFASPNRLAERIESTPIVSTIWDLGHRDLPEFPEFRGRVWRARESLYQSTLPRSFHTFTDSESTRSRIVDIYGLVPQRVSSIGLLYESKAEVDPPAAKASPVEGRYFVYPAKKWAHKNHHVILAALAQVVDHYPDAKLVLTGADGSASQDLVKERTRRWGLTDNVVDLGYVDEAELDGLVRNAAALLMPSYLGPTNIPPLHALSVGTPVIASDRHCFDGRVQESLLLVSPTSPDAWAAQMLGVLRSSLRVEPIVQSRAGARQEISAVLARFWVTRESWS